jgi:N-acetylglucosaminyl-diphospho-decaprenol L-rhamnosyltransferase
MASGRPYRIRTAVNDDLSVANEARAIGALPVYLIHFDAPDWVRAAATSVLRSDIPIDLVVVNNGPQTALELPAGVRVLETGANLGYAGGANVGLREWLAGTEPYCVVASHDLHVESDTLRRLVESGERLPRYGILGPRLDGAKPGEFTRDDGIERVAWASGTCLLLRRSCIERIGFFDEDFHSYSEDAEIGLRAADAGFWVGRVPTARAHGLGSSSPDSSVLTVATNLVLRHKRGGTAEVAKGVLTNARMMLVSAVLCVAARDAHRREGHRVRLRYLVRGTVSGLRRVAMLSSRDL